MYPITVLVNYKKDTLSNSAINAAMEGLGELIKKSVEPFAEELKGQKGSISIRVNSIKDVVITSENMSQDLLSRITVCVQKLSSPTD
jgi:hypothetical protein